MPEIKPFKAIYYNKEKISDLSQVVAPPYDVVSEEERRRLYNLNESNIIRIILPDQYTRAAKLLDSWLAEGILLEFPEEAIYIYEQEYTALGKRRKRIGFIGAMKLEDDDSGRILPHENTFSHHEMDRLSLLRASGTNTSPIFSLISDDDSIIKEITEEQTTRHLLYSIELDGITHRLWAQTDKGLIGKLTSSLKEKPAFIADGHHRYQVSRQYRAELKANRIEAPDSDYVMMYFTDLNDENLIILPTHRLINITEGHNLEKLLKEGFCRYFDISLIEDRDKLFAAMEKAAKSEHVFGLYAGGNKYYLLRLKQSVPVEDKWIDVTILHDIVFEKILGIEDKCGHDRGTIYLKDPPEAEEMVKRGKFSLAFFLNPTHIDEVVKVASSGGRMPHKSTYFYPKLLSGLVMRRMRI